MRYLSYVYSYIYCVKVSISEKYIKTVNANIAEIKGEIAEEPPEKIGEETHKMWISLILCAVSAEAALEKKDE